MLFMTMEVKEGRHLRDTYVKFNTTHWSVVLAAGQEDSRASFPALEKLCETYWSPLYSYARRVGNSPHAAEDLTQSFVTRLIEKSYLQAVDQTKGRFRSFLLTAFKRFLADEYDKATALKRGGHCEHLSLDAQEAEERYGTIPLDELTPEMLFDRQCALTLLKRAESRLRAEYKVLGKSDLLEAIIQHQGGNDQSYAELAARARIPENTFKSHLHRMRQRYRKLLLEEISRTVSDATQVRDEVQYFLTILGK
jgi:RNA polymerase sigma factor (sigma-70 family)